MILDRQKPAIMRNRTLGTQQEKRVILPSSETLFANDNFSSSYVDAQVSEWYAMFNTTYKPDLAFTEYAWLLTVVVVVAISF